jgi:hypothetical protein
MITEMKYKYKKTFASNIKPDPKLNRFLRMIKASGIFAHENETEKV